MCFKLGLLLFTVSCHEETSAIDLLGRHIIKGAETIWLDGPVTKAVRQGGVIYLDEIAEARPDTIVALHSLTDYRRSIYLDRLSEELKAPNHFMLVASYNPGYQGLNKELKASTKQRFVSFYFPFPETEAEVEIICQESGCEKEIAEKLVRLAVKIRNLVDLGLTETASTRLLVNTAKLIQDGLPPRMSCEAGIVQPLTDELDTIQALKELASLVF